MPDTPADRAREVAPSERFLPVIWAAMLLAVFLYAALSYYLESRPPLLLEVDLQHWALVFLGMSSGLHVLTAFLLRQAIAALTKGSYVGYCIVRWALLEAIGVYGFVLAMLGVDFAVTSIFFMAGLLTIGGTRPGATDREAFVGLFR